MTLEEADSPCGYAMLVSIGGLGVEENQVLTKAVCDFVHEKLGIPGKR